MNDLVQMRANMGLPETLTKHELEVMYWILAGMRGHVSEKGLRMIGDLIKCGYVAADQPIKDGWRGYAVTDNGRDAIKKS